MSRPVWVGSLSFGLVSVPVRLYSAISPRPLQFHLLHDEDGARIQNKRVCSADGEEVPFEHVVKGYALADGRHVQITRGELEAFDPESARSIELEDFVEAGEIDPLYYDTSYHLVPAEGAERAYALLVATLREAGRVGIGRFVLYQKGHLVAVRPHGRGLLLSTLHYAEDVVSQDSLSELALAGARPQERELEVALSLVEARATDFEPRRYHDVHRERLLAFLERRARKEAGGRRVHAGATVQQPPRGDLLAALEQSVAALRAGQPLPPPPQQGALRVRPQASAHEAREARELPQAREPHGGGETPTSGTPGPQRKTDGSGKPSA
ncbi:non-homologous end joining protein Ku [Pyxidicoccus xibeiensis]|uniref:non-homologous end joining protein Ku n=1 Tax=Pyxidicoccus xibeiensis TaxID=2906759 RepID=UPI0020A73096|nr:Ku protein [Pyxidicoccus xibeiensis]MCP3144306.1 Ku protein [Pyxidicoccus xibeiensis]